MMNARPRGKWYPSQRTKLRTTQTATSRSEDPPWKLVEVKYKKKKKTKTAHSAGSDCDSSVQRRQCTQIKPHQHSDKKSKPKVNHTLNCIFMNADTITNKMAELNLLVCEQTPDIIGVNEVLAKNFNRQIYLEECTLNNYEMVAHTSISASKGRGTILYIRKGINYKQIDVLYKGHEFQESVYVEISLADNNTLLCACMYRRGETNDKNNETLCNI